MRARTYLAILGAVGAGVVSYVLLESDLTETSTGAQPAVSPPSSGRTTTPEPGRAGEDPASFELPKLVSVAAEEPAAPGGQRSRTPDGGWTRGDAVTRSLAEGRGVLAKPFSREVLRKNLETFESSERQAAEMAAKAMGLTDDETARVREIVEMYLKESWDAREAAPADAPSLFGPPEVEQAARRRQGALRELLGAERLAEFRVAQYRARRELRGRASHQQLLKSGDNSPNRAE
jgi:hypothetical protein